MRPYIVYYVIYIKTIIIIITIGILLLIVYNSTMENLNSNYIESYINLQALLSQQVNSQCNDDFISFVRLLAPSLVSGFKMGRHIEVISEKLQQIENGELKRLMVFLPPRSSKSI